MNGQDRTLWLQPESKKVDIARDMVHVAALAPGPPNVCDTWQKAFARVRRHGNHCLVPERTHGRTEVMKQTFDAEVSVDRPSLQVDDSRQALIACATTRRRCLS
jgi:hypothetical protein